MTRTWDASAYDRVSAPQQVMAGPVLDRLDLTGDETVLDAGCGSGAVTEMLLERVPRGAVIALDADAAMVAHARDALGDRAEVRRADLTEFTLDRPVDAVFSNAVFHWVTDHPALFARLAAALKPGGRLSAQCGGRGNIARLHAHARAEFPGNTLPSPWTFAGPEETAERLRAAGFTDVACWLEPWPVRPEDPRGYLRTVCLGPHLDVLPAAEHEPFLDAVLARLGPEPELDYVRLNLTATRA